MSEQYISKLPIGTDFKFSKERYRIVANPDNFKISRHPLDKSESVIAAKIDDKGCMVLVDFCPQTVVEIK